MRKTLFTTVACIAFSVGHASAQLADGLDDTEKQVDADRTLSTVVVTAERGDAKDLQGLALAVTALPANELQARGVQTARDLANLVPSLQVGTQSNGPSGTSATFWLRGLGQIRSGNGSEPAVPLYIDDFYYPALSGNILRAMDIEQVEVLRGPQGTLFGRNSIGGAIRYQTRKPDENFGGYVEGTVGSYDRQDIIGALNIPVGDKLAVRLTGAALETGGFVDTRFGEDQEGGTENDLFRAQVRYRPVENLTVDASYEVSAAKAFGSTTYIPEISTAGVLATRWNSNPVNVPTFDQSLAANCVYCAYGNLPVPDYSDALSQNTHLVVDWDISNSVKLKLLSGQSIVKSGYQNDVDGTPALVGLQYSQGRTKATSHELQALGTPTNWLQYVVGVYYYDEETSGYGGQQTPNRVGVVRTNEAISLRGRESISAYGNFQFVLSEKLSATLGVRLGTEEATISTESVPLVPALSNSGAFEEDVFLPMVKLQYDWTPSVMTYASYAQGYRAGGFNIVPANAAIIPFNAEDVNSYEIGARTEFLDGRVRVNPTLFYTDYQEMQINSQYIPPPPFPPAPTSILENAGQSVLYGAELESAFVLTPEFLVNFSASYLEGQYEELNPSASIVITDPLPRIPKWFYTVGARYERPVGVNWDFTANLDWSWRDDQYGSAAKDRVVVESYGLLSGQLQLANIEGDWNVAVFGTNLLDKEYITGGLNLLGLVGNLRYDMGRPREIGLRIKKSF